MKQSRSKTKKLDLIVSEIAKIKATLKKLAKANKALAVAVAKAPIHPKQKKNPKRGKAPRTAVAAKTTAIPTPRKRPVLVKLPDVIEPNVKGSAK